MWWRWIIFVLCGICILACVVDTTINWIRGKTGPFGPRPEEWWGCGVFTIILIAVMWWVGRQIFMK